MQDTDVKKILSERIGLLEIEWIVNVVFQEKVTFAELYACTLECNKMLSWHALWACEHICKRNKNLLLPYRAELIDRVLKCNHAGQKRIMLNILQLLPDEEPLRVDFLDGCFAWMLSKTEPVATRSLCVKLIYRMVHDIPELYEELCRATEMLTMEESAPSILSCVRKVRKSQRKKLSENI